MIRTNIYVLPLAIAALLTSTPTSFSQTQEANAIGVICVGPAGISDSAYITIPPDNGSGFKFNPKGSPLGTPRTLPFAVNIHGRSVNDTVSLTNGSAAVKGGPGCKLDLVSPVQVNFTAIPGEPGSLQATGQLQVFVGTDTENSTNRGTTYTCLLEVTFTPPTTVYDTQNLCGTVIQTIGAIPLSFPWYRKF